MLDNTNFERQKKKKKLYSWLICQNKKLGCTICQKVKAAGPEASSRHMHVSEEWAKVKVVPPGSNKNAQQQSLCKKNHRTSDYHRSAEKILQKAQDKTLEMLTTEMMRDHFLTTNRVFCTVYKTVKSGRPFTDLPTDIDLQVLNGIDMGRTLHSDKPCVKIRPHIACEMRKTVVAKN